MNHDIHIGRFCRMIHLKIEQSNNNYLKKYNLTRTQSTILFFLQHQPDKCASQKQIEELLQISQPTAVRIIKSMETKGFIKIEIKKEHNGKKYITSLFEESDFWTELINSNREMTEQIQKGFSQEELTLFYSYLVRTYQNLLGDGESIPDFLMRPAEFEDIE